MSFKEDDAFWDDLFWSSQCGQLELPLPFAKRLQHISGDGNVDVEVFDSKSLAKSSKLIPKATPTSWPSPTELETKGELRLMAHDLLSEITMSFIEKDEAGIHGNPSDSRYDHDHTAPPILDHQVFLSLEEARDAALEANLPENHLWTRERHQIMRSKFIMKELDSKEGEECQAEINA